MSAADWSVKVRDKFGNRLGQVEFKSLSIKHRFNDLSKWSMIINRQDRMAQDLLQPGAGIIVYRNDAVYFSGLVLTVEHNYSDADNTLTLTGDDDTVWLARRLASPQPGTSAPPYNSTAEDVRTGVASTIMQQFFLNNLGSSAIASRQGSFMTVTNASDPVIGPSLTGSGRWQSLLQLLQELAIASEAAGTTLGFQIRQSGDSLQFRIYATNDYTASVVFSRDMGNIAAFTYTANAPTITYAIAGGDGEGTARTIREKQGSLMPEWGRIENDLIDARNAANNAEIDQASDKALKEGAGTTSLSITPIDRDTLAFGTDYNLGDKVTVQLPSVGPTTDTVVATGVANGTGATNHLQMTDAAATAFTIGMRVRLYLSTGVLKEYGTRTVTDKISSGGNTDVYFSPTVATATVSGDYLQGFIPADVAGATIQDVIREVNVTINDGGESIVPSIGDTNASLGRPRMFTTTRDLKRRIRNLERR